MGLIPEIRALGEGYMLPIARYMERTVIFQNIHRSWVLEHFFILPPTSLTKKGAFMENGHTSTGKKKGKQKATLTFISSWIEERICCRICFLINMVANIHVFDDLMFS